MKEEKIKVKTTSICCGYGHKIKKKKKFQQQQKKRTLFCSASMDLYKIKLPSKYFIIY